MESKEGSDHTLSRRLRILGDHTFRSKGLHASAKGGKAILPSGDTMKAGKW